MGLNWTVNNTKNGNTPFLHQPPPPFSGLSPLSSKKICTPPPQVTQFLEGRIPPFNKGGSNYDNIDFNAQPSLNNMQSLKNHYDRINKTHDFLRNQVLW